MKVEITKEQKEALAKKIDLCVDFLKTEIQPYLTSKDKVIVEVGEFLELVITPKELYVKNIRLIDIGFTTLSFSKVLQLENNIKTAKKYICSADPESAVIFLKFWDKTKNYLLGQVLDKTTEVNKLNDFINGFQL